MKAKIWYTFILLLALLSLNYSADNLDNKKMDLIERNCYHSLMHGNAGVKEAAIFVSIQFKNRFPNWEDEKLLEALEELVRDSDNPVISYKAQLARLYFKNNELFDEIEINSIENEQKVFNEISSRINNLKIAVNFQ
jgi:hypothetical protein